MNIQGAGGVMETEIHTAESFVPEPSASEVEVAAEKLESYKLPCADQIPSELIEVGDTSP
jgi:hypothetical protein